MDWLAAALMSLGLTAVFGLGVLVGVIWVTLGILDRLAKLKQLGKK